MFRIENQTALTSSFRELDRETVEIPREFQFPLFVRNTLTWLENSGNRVFLVFLDPQSRKRFGIAFRRDSERGTTSHHCEWCHSFGGPSEIGLLTATASEKRRVGIHLCLDLSCFEKIEARTGLTGENSRLLSHQLQLKISEFARRNLF
jgi:hypothetical protein